MPMQRRNSDLADLLKADLDWGPFHPRVWVINGSGGALAVGDLVAASAAVDHEVVTTVTQADGIRLVGIIAEGGANGAVVQMRTSGTGYVTVDAGGCAWGDQLSLSTGGAPGEAQVAGAGDFVFGVALEDSAAGGLTKCVFSFPVATGAGGVSLPHNLLSTTHPDTDPKSPPDRGDIVVARGSAPGTLWTAYGAIQDYVLYCVGLDPTWVDPAMYLPIAPTAGGSIIVSDGTPAWTEYGVIVPGAPTINYLGVENGETTPTYKSASSVPGAAAEVLQTNAVGGVAVMRLGVNQPIPGTDGICDVSLQYDIGADRVLAIPGVENVVCGVGAGTALTTEDLCTFLGQNAGNAFNDGTQETYLGAYAGGSAVGGENDLFAGYRAGENDQYGYRNVYLGAYCGSQSALGAHDNTAVGMESLSGVLTAAANYHAVLGYQAGAGITSGAECALYGAGAGGSITTESYLTLLGTWADIVAGASSSIALGYNATVRASHQLVVGHGSAAGYINDSYWGSGVIDNAPWDFAFNATGGSGTNIAAANLTIAGGKGTGSGAGGHISFQTAPASVPGAALNPLVTVLELTDVPTAVFSYPVTVPAAGLIYTGMARGDLLTGNATPAFARLALGGIVGSIVTRDATDVLWSGYALSGTAGQTYTFPAVSGTVALGAGTLTVATANNVTGATHTHAITSSSNPGAAAAILASNASGYLQLTGFSVNTALSAGYGSEINKSGTPTIIAQSSIADSTNAAASSGHVVGYLGGMQHTGAGNLTAVMSGAPGPCGMYGRVQHRSGATITSAKAISGRVLFVTAAGTGAITHAPIFYAQDAINSSGATGTMGTQYGYYCESLVFATTNYCLYSVGATTPSYHAGQLAVGGTVAAAATIHAHQSSATGAVPPLLLNQSDIDEDMIEFVGTIGVGNCIEAVGAKTLTVTHFIKITLPGSLTRYIPVGTIA